MKNLRRERHKGFYSYEDAYNWIVDEFDGDSRYKFGFKFCSLEDLIKKELYVEKTGIGPNFGVGLLHECGST